MIDELDEFGEARRNPEPAGPIFGKLLKEIVKKAKPSRKALKGRRLAQKLLSAELGERSKYADVASVKTGVVTIEVNAAALFQELEGYQKARLMQIFRDGGLQVSEVRVRLAR